ncbi:MAG: hypothetical protein JSV77_03070 [Dehalococcoidales bacterium]|nr:MAG: hypothetical protein JSV77_03070 [Dehalococcoidales bacterium]
METVLTILMFLGIYVVFPLLVATIVCGIALLARRRARSVEIAKRAKAPTAAKKVGLAHHPAKT